MDDRLEIKNNSDKDIYIQIDSHYLKTTASDSVLLFYDIKNDPKKYKIQSGDTKKYVVYEKWEYIFSESDTLSFFIFDAETIDNTAWETIPTAFKYLIRYDLSIEDMHQLHWTIVYPPEGL